MAEVSNYANGKPCWVDLGSPNLDESIRFYSELFGWECSQGPEEFSSYTMCVYNGAPVAGLAPLKTTSDAKPNWTTYIAVDDIEVAIKAITNANGNVTSEIMDASPFGKSAQAVDTSGATFSIWKAGSHFGAGLVNEPNTWVWSELTTRQNLEATKFYGEVFGWNSIVRENQQMPYTEFQLDGRSMAGMISMDENWPAAMPSHWMTYFAVESCDSATSKVTALGGECCVPPFDLPIGRISVCNDKHGSTFSLIQMAS